MVGLRNEAVAIVMMSGKGVNQQLSLITSPAPCTYTLPITITK